MGNSCTRNSETQVVLSEHGVRVQRRNDRDRGRWSAPNAESVDLDTLLEAPSPPPPRRRRKKEKSLSSISEHFHAQSRGHAASSALPPRHRAKPHRNRGRAGSRRKSAPPPEDEPPMYHSYEDPGYLAGDPVDLQPFDCDAILGSPLNSPLNSPSVIHARWGEPVDDPDEENVCTDFRPNPFKLGFCVNCQKQHDVDADGEVVAMKEYKKIARPTIAKYAANALDLPDAVPPPTRASISHLPEGGRESDIDLAQLLTQRREVLMRLNQIESQSKQQRQQQQRRKPPSSGPVPTMRHSTMFFGDTSNGSLGNLRRMSSRPPSSGPIMARATSVVLSPHSSSSRGVSKSVSLGSRLYDDEEPAQSIWL